MRRVAALTAAMCSVALFGCSIGSASFDWREVSFAGRGECLPVAFTMAAQERGLQGVRHVARPMVFAYSPPATPSFWMKDTPTPLTGVWVGASKRVIGYWHGQPESTALHPAPAPVSAVVEYRQGVPVPAIGTPVSIGGHCAAQPGGL
jgi:uncharacterized membrane protein (UPF0127 family)